MGVSINTDTCKFHELDSQYAPGSFDFNWTQQTKREKMAEMTTWITMVQRELIIPHVEFYLFNTHCHFIYFIVPLAPLLPNQPPQSTKQRRTLRLTLGFSGSDRWEGHFLYGTRNGSLGFKNHASKNQDTCVFVWTTNKNYIGLPSAWDTTRTFETTVGSHY